MANRKLVSHLENTGKSWLDKKVTPTPSGFQEFPKRLHHKTKPSVVVADAAGEKALGSEYAESPADFEETGDVFEVSEVAPAEVEA